MAHIRIGNAPCSWGVLEFDLEGEAAGYTQVLNEMAETGYVGTELGDWDFMPTDPDALAAELNKRGLTMLGAFVPVALKDPAAHAPGVEAALKVARLLAPRRPIAPPAICPIWCWPTTTAAVPDRTRKRGPRDAGDGAERCRVEDLRRGRGSGRADSLRRDRAAHGLPSSLRRLRRNARRDRPPARA